VAARYLASIVMHGKRVQFDDDTWHAIETVADETGSTFPELAAEAFADLLKKHHQPVGFFAALEQSLGGHGRSRKKRATNSVMRHKFSGT
jgi:hypothetical protein